MCGSRRQGKARLAWGHLAYCTRGAVAIEFALVIGLLIALILGILQTGLAIQQRGAMERVLAQEIRRGQIQSGVSDADLRDRLTSRLKSKADGDVTIEFEELELEGEDLPYRRVIAHFPYSLQIPLVSAFSITMRAEAIARNTE